MLPDGISRNVIAEIPGWEKPEEIVIVSGHIDSWDIGQGAMDDGGGCLAAWEAARLMLKLGLKLGLEALDIIELLSGCPLVVLGELRHQPVDASLQQVANHLAPAAGTGY